MSTTAERPRRLLRRPTFAGLAIALVFWWQSLRPTLLPRGVLSQAAVSAVCVAVGYAIGTLLGYLAHSWLRSRSWTPPDRVRRIAWMTLAAVTAVVLVVGIVVWPRWQNDQRDLVSLGHISAWTIVPIIVLTVVLATVLGFIGRLIWLVIRALDRLLDRFLSRPVAIAGTVVIVFFVGRFLTEDVAFEQFKEWANDQFGKSDTETAPGTEPPTSPAVSGSPESLVRWEDLGYEGRNFVAEATTSRQLAGFHGGDAELSDPIRVYVGTRSADSIQAQSDLAVQELERTGAFDRSILCVVTTTGTGWVDPDSASALEQLYVGDTAIVSIQYSYLPSWISFLVDSGAAAPAGSLLFDAVYDRWSRLPADDRPQLVVFGESLGSYGAEAAFAGFDATASVANLRARTDGALFTGPINDNLIWSQITDEREEGSPVWRPVFDGGRTVQAGNTAADLLDPDPDWDPPRVLYIHHPSDPVGSWNMETMWSRPDWTYAPHGADVPSRVGWFPFVTWAQEVADLAAGFSAPAGHGHDYSVDFVAGWAAVIPPDGWTSEDTERLQDFLGAG